MNLSDQELDERYNQAILKADPSKLSDEELDLRLSLAEKKAQPEGESPWTNPRAWAKAGAESLPLAGSVGGGLLGFASPVPGGAMVGAGLGAGLGKSAQQFIEEQFLNEEPKGMLEKAKEIGQESLMGAAGEGAGLVLAKGLSKALPAAGKLFTIAGKKPNAEAIEKAAESLGTKATTGMLYDSPYMQKIESSLEQSPSMAGALVRRETGPVRKTIQKTADDVFAEIPRVQPSDVGDKVKEGLSTVIEDRLKPISKSYDTIRESTGNVELREKSIQSVAKNIEDIEKFKSSPAYSLVHTVAEDLRAVKSADELKSLRSTVGKRLSNKMLDPTEYSALNQIYGKLSQLEKNSIMRSAIENAGNTNRGKSIAKGLISELKETNKQFGGLIGDIKEISQGAKTGKNLKRVGQFVDKLDELPSEKIVDTLFKTNNRAHLEKMQKTFPDQYEALRQAKLDSIRKSAESDKGVSPRKLLNIVKGIEPDTQKMIFGPKAKDMIDNLEIIVKNSPDMVGPSGTPSGIEWMNFLNPEFYIREPGRLAQYGLLKGFKTINKGAEGLIRAGKSPTIGELSRFGTKAYALDDE